jgi:hypothetical protein
MQKNMLNYQLIWRWRYFSEISSIASSRMWWFIAREPVYGPAVPTSNPTLSLAQGKLSVSALGATWDGSWTGVGSEGGIGFKNATIMYATTFRISATMPE